MTLTPSPPKWLKQTLSRMRSWRRRGQGPKLVVAVSGGRDSVAMLRALHQLQFRSDPPWQLIVAHLNHGFRGRQADDDAEFVAELAQQLGLPCEVGQWLPRRSCHLEADARQARYDWLIEVATRHQANVIATGHTRDDQAETVLHRIIRGTGLRGLAGIPISRRLTKSILLTRPILHAYRYELEIYLEHLCQPYREDPTNADVEHQTRARIRHDFLPYLSDRLNPQVEEALIRLAEQARQAQSTLDRFTRKWQRHVLIEETLGGWILDRHRLARLDRYVRVELFRRLWRMRAWPEATMTARQWYRLANLCQRPGQSLSVVGRITAQVDEDHLKLDDGSAALDDLLELDDILPISVEIPSESAWPQGGELTVALNGCNCLSDQTTIEHIDADQVVGQLVLDRGRLGDRLRPLGMTSGSVRLVELLRRQGIPPDRRECEPVLRDEEGIVWAIGHRIADRVRCTSGTQSRLILCWSPPI